MAARRKTVQPAHYYLQKLHSPNALYAANTTVAQPAKYALYLPLSVTLLFEATPVSLGRGTTSPFQVYGHPNMIGYNFSFIPQSTSGARKPPQMGLRCYGRNLTTQPTNEEVFKRGVDLQYLIDAYNNLHIGNHFFNPFFEKLIGVDYVRK